MSVGQMSLGQISVAQMSVGQMVFDKKARGRGRQAVDRSENDDKNLFSVITVGTNFIKLLWALFYFPSGKRL